MGRPLHITLALLLAGCQGSIDTARLDGGRPDQYVTYLEGGIITQDFGLMDRGSYPDTAPGVDLTTRAGDPCTYGKCAEGLICMANICHAVCSTDCGDKAPECQATEGCHWVTSFSAACMPGTATYLQKCGDGVWCVGGNLCVKIGSSSAKCLKLCKYGCPSGSYCGQTSNGCKVCIQ